MRTSTNDPSEADRQSRQELLICASIPLERLLHQIRPVVLALRLIHNAFTGLFVIHAIRYRAAPLSRGPDRCTRYFGHHRNKFGARCYGNLGSSSSVARAVDAGIALAETSFAASRPSINGEQPKSGIPSRRKVRSSSMPRESANVNPCRLRHTRSDALAIATICRVSPTHAPINFPSRPIDTSVICTGWVMRSNSCTSG